MKCFIVLFVLFVSCGLYSCRQVEPLLGSFQEYYSPHSWELTPPGEVGFHQPALDSMMVYLKDSIHHINSLLIVKDNRLVLEEYFEGLHLDISNSRLDFSNREFDRDMLQFAASVTKSVNAVLVGIAVEKGFISEINDPVAKYFPDYRLDEEKQSLTVRDFLTMTSGIPWSEDYAYDDSRNDLGQMWADEDPIGFVFAKPIATEVGTEFLYNSGASNILGEIIRRTSGRSLDEFAKEFLFSPLGIEDFLWVGFQKADHIKMASSGLYLRAIDFAKFAELVRQEGKWVTEQIVSPFYIRQAVQKSVEVPRNRNPVPDFIDGYGYQWWTGNFRDGEDKAYIAAGFGGQFLFIFPEHEMSVIINGSNYEDPDYNAFFNFVDKFILGALD